MSTEKIIATVPASGYRATFTDDDASDPVEHPIVAWQLIENRDGDGSVYQQWVGIAVWEDGPQRCDAFADFRGYEPVKGWSARTPRHRPAAHPRGYRTRSP